MVWEKISKFFVYAAVLLTPIFIIPLTAFHLTLSKQFLLSNIILIAYICLLISKLISGQITYPKTKLNPAIIVLVILTAISALLSGATNVGFFGINGGEVDSTLNILSFGLLFFIIGAIFHNQKQEIKKLVSLFLISSAIVIIHGLIQFSNIFILPWDFAANRTFNLIGTTNSFGFFAGAVFALILPVVYFKNKLSKPIFIYLSLLLSLVSFIAAILIGYWPIFIGWIFTGALILFTEKQKNRKKSAYFQIIPRALIVISIVIILSHFLFGFNLEILKLPPEIMPNLKSTWDIAYQTISQNVKNFVFGSGPATLQYQYSLFNSPEINKTPFWNLRFTQGFNSVLSHLTNWGVAGTLVFLIFIALAIIQIFRQFKNNSTNEWFIGISSGIIYLTITLFFYNQNIILYFTLFFLIGLFNSLFNEDKRTIKLKPLTSIYSILIIALVIISLIFIYLKDQKYYGSILFKKAVDAINQQSNLDAGQQLFARAVKLDPRNDAYLREESLAYLIKIGEIISNSDSKKENEIQQQVGSLLSKSIESAKKATLVNSLNGQNLMNLGRVYENAIPITKNALENATKYYSEAANLEPNNPTIYFNIGRSYVSEAAKIERQAVADSKIDINKLYQDAVASLEKAINLKPDYAEPHFLIVQIFKKQGKTNELLKKLENIKSLSPKNPGLLFQIGLIHFQDDRINQAEKEFSNAVAIAPNYSNARYFLGLIYDNKNNKTKALNEFKKIKALNPENNDVKKIISNLEAGLPALDKFPSSENNLEPPIEQVKNDSNQQEVQTTD